MGGWATKEARLSWYKRNAIKLRKKAIEYRKANPAKRKETVKRFQDKVEAVILALKAHPCTDCKNEYPPCVMQFDHVRGEKVMDVAKLRAQGKIKAILLEVTKCDLVCANCHAIRTCRQSGRAKKGTCSHE